MNSPRNNDHPHRQQPADRAALADETLRLIAGLPAPEGLASRVQAGLRAAPQPGRVLSWRSPLRSGGGWMHNGMVRGAAAAAIVCVVAGGGWRIYSHVQPAPSARVIAMPPRVAPGGGGLTPAGAKRVPDTLDGPVLAHPKKDEGEQKLESPAPSNSVATPSPGGVVGKKKKAASRVVARPMP